MLPSFGTKMRNLEFDLKFLNCIVNMFCDMYGRKAFSDFQRDLIEGLAANQIKRTFHRNRSDKKIDSQLAYLTYFGRTGVDIGLLTKELNFMR